MLLLLSVFAFPSFVGYRQPSVFSQISSLFISDSQLNSTIETQDPFAGFSWSFQSDLTVFRTRCFVICVMISFYLFVLLFHTEHIGK